MVDVTATNRPQVVFHSFGTFTDLGGKYQSGHDDLFNVRFQKARRTDGVEVVPAKFVGRCSDVRDIDYGWFTR